MNYHIQFIESPIDERADTAWGKGKRLKNERVDTDMCGWYLWYENEWHRAKT